MKQFLNVEEKGNALQGHSPKDYPIHTLHGRAIRYHPEQYLFLFLSSSTTSLQKGGSRLPRAKDYRHHLLKLVDKFLVEGMVT